MSAQAFLDKFKILKGISRLRDEESLYLLHQGLAPRIMSLIYGSDIAPPDNYADFVTKVQRSHSTWISTIDISMCQDQQEPTINHLQLGINKPDQELLMVDQDMPWKLMPWAHAVIIVDSLATLPTSV